MKQYKITELEKVLEILGRYKNEKVIFVSPKRIDNIFSVIAIANGNNQCVHINYDQLENIDKEELKSYIIINLDDNIEVIDKF